LSRLVAEVVDKLNALDASQRRVTIPLGRDNRNSDVADEKDYDLDLRQNLHDSTDSRFNSQRENFAHLYISAPATDNDDVIYGQVRGREQMTDGRATGFSVDRRSHFAGDIRRRSFINNFISFYFNNFLTACRE